MGRGACTCRSAYSDWIRQRPRPCRRRRSRFRLATPEILCGRTPRRDMVPLLEGRRRAERRGACSATGALRGFQLGDLLASGRSGRIFNDQDRCLVCVVVSDVDHAKASSPQWDRVASAPRRHRRTERGRVGRCSVLELEPVDEASHSVLPFIGWDRTPGSAYRRGRRINFGASAPQTAAPVWSPALAPRLQTRPPALRLRPRRRTPPRRSPAIDRDLAEVSESKRPALAGKRAPAELGAGQLVSEGLPVNEVRIALFIAASLARRSASHNFRRLAPVPPRGVPLVDDMGPERWTFRAQGLRRNTCSASTYSGIFRQWRWYQAPKSKLACGDNTR
jgi:hypothetical protein